MHLPRITFAACLACALASPARAQAPAYPDKPVRVVVGSAPGGNADTLARIVCQRLTQRYEQQFVVENRAGANGAIGTEVAAKARPDGYTLMFAASNHTINPSLYPKLTWDPVKGFTPIGLVGVTPLVLTVTQACSHRRAQLPRSSASSKPASRRSCRHRTSGNASPRSAPSR